MKLAIALISLGVSTGVWSQAWEVLPKGVRIVGYRNVQTNKINSNFNRIGSESPLGAQFRVDARTFNSMIGNIIQPGTDVDANAYNTLLVGEYKVDAQAQVNAHGTGIGYGITNNVMFYAEVAYYNAQVNTNIKRTAGNTYEQTSALLQQYGGLQNEVLAENLRRMIDADESTIQSVVTNHYKYQPLGNWYGSGFGDMETGLMAKVIDKDAWGLLLYPGIVLPTGRQDDPDILQDIGFGDGQFDFFGEAATGYIVDDALSFGTTLRYTYQAPTAKRLRVPGDRDFQLSTESSRFDVKYGDKINWMLKTTYAFNDWISITPIYRYMYQMPSKYYSNNSTANTYLAYNSDKIEHQGQLTATLSSITPFLKKKFLDRKSVV